MARRPGRAFEHRCSDGRGTYNQPLSPLLISGFAMRVLLLACCLVPAALAPSVAGEPEWIELVGDKKMDVWRRPLGKWIVAGGAEVDPKNPRRLVAKPGKGVLINGKTGREHDLVSRQSFGDVELEMEFLIAKKSNSGVKFLAVYEIQITDSHGKKTELTGDDCGGVYPRAEQKPKYHHLDKGIAPRTNAAKPAGRWQKLHAIFLAPRFDRDGKKVASARLVEVTLNGQLIHDNVELKTPTGHNWKKKETATGPLLLQGDHGPVAFRNVRLRPYRAK